MGVSFSFANMHHFAEDDCLVKKPICILVFRFRYNFVNVLWGDMYVVCANFQMPLFNILPHVLVLHIVRDAVSSL